MPAIRSHSTDTVDESWDGPANKARVRTDQDPEYFEKIYAWRDPDGDPRLKTSYRFIHHEVSEDGTPGPANIRACITGIAVLNGARGGTVIPEADIRGVYDHLARHLRDADREVPDLKREGASAEMERRSLDLELQAVETGNAQRVIEGYAAVYERLSGPIGPGFREVFRRGAFSWAPDRDVVALWNHNTNLVLGRTSNQTLHLEEAADGVRFRLHLPDTQWGRDAWESIRRRDVQHMSIGFRVMEDSWKPGNPPVREVLRAQLVEVSPVVFPAYPQTTVTVRSLAERMSFCRLEFHRRLVRLAAAT